MLKQFEQKYMPTFKATGMKYRDRNLRKIYLKHFPHSEPVIEQLRELDTLANVLWPLAHLKAAGHYLQKHAREIKATGGTNWQKFLPPRYQRIIFFPMLIFFIELNAASAHRSPSIAADTIPPA